MAWGPTPLGENRWRVGLWAPSVRDVRVLVQGESVRMRSDGDGHWHATIEADPGSTYLFEIDGTSFPDPASRSQAEGVHGPSVLVGDTEEANDWAGRDWAEAVVFEMHIGTFTRDGTLRAATERLDDLAALGITFVELMPIAQFHGRRGGGYDGVLPYALHDAYGTRDDLRAFVARAHDLGMGVLLDVVYNHFGPEGAYLHSYCPEFFRSDRTTPWGAGIDFARPEVRSYFLDSAVMWIRSFGFDGLRLDAVHAIVDESEPHFLVELARRLKVLPLRQPIHLITEDERNVPDLRERGMDASWNDDYHHAVHCLTTGEHEGYYASFSVDPMADLCLALERGHVEEGQDRPGRADRRGASCGHLPVQAFVNANQTHDQIGNRARGERLISVAGTEAVWVLHGLLLCAPYVPMLFMGEEIGARRPFLFFCDFDGDLASDVRKGRQAEFEAFNAFTGKVPDPCSRDTFLASRPYDAPPEDAEDWRAWTRRLLAFRRERIVPITTSARLDARAEPTAERALRAEWTFEGGRIVIEANIGTPPERPGDWTGADLSYNSPGDDFALAVWSHS